VFITAQYHGKGAKMEIKQAAVAGTLESSDIHITLEPAGGGIAVDLSSNVMNQYGRQIQALIVKTLADLDVGNVKVIAVDKGALDCTIKARVECAVYRAAGFEGSIPWGGVS